MTSIKISKIFLLITFILISKGNRTIILLLEQYDFDNINNVILSGMVEEADTVHQDIVQIDTGTETIDVIIVLIETAEIDTEKGTGVQGREIIIENEVAAEKGIVKLSIENIMKTEIVTETGRGKGTGKA